MYYYYYKLNRYYYKVKGFIKNLPFFLKQAWRWRSWDAHFSIDLLHDSLLLIAKDLKEDIWHKGALKQSRRCTFAAHLLNKAYNDSVLMDDASMLNWSRNNKLDIEDCGLVWTRKYDEKYSRSLREVIDKRILAIEASRKKEAWEYIHKHIGSFWA